MVLFDSLEAHSEQKRENEVHFRAFVVGRKYIIIYSL